MAPLPPRDQRHLWLHYQVVRYTKKIVHDFEQRLETTFGRQVNRVHILDFKGLTPDMRQDLTERLRMVYNGDDGQEVFVSHAWRRLFRIRAPLVQEFILEFFSTCYILPRRWQRTDLEHTSLRQPDAVAGAPGAAEDVPAVDEGAQGDLRRRCKGYGRLAHHFGLVSDDGLRGLSVVACELSLIDIGELVAAAGAPKAAEDALEVNEGAQADLPPLRTKTSSKFSIIVRKYVMEPSTLSKSRAELRRDSDFK
ncbi:hypothetical protein Tco_1451505 [Tanacetum coccineum]